MKYDCYAADHSGTFEVDLNDPIEGGKEMHKATIAEANAKLASWREELKAYRANKGDTTK